MADVVGRPQPGKCLSRGSTGKNSRRTKTKWLVLRFIGQRAPDEVLNWKALVLKLAARTRLYQLPCPWRIPWPSIYWNNRIDHGNETLNTRNKKKKKKKRKKRKKARSSLLLLFESNYVLLCSVYSESNNLLRRNRVENTRNTFD